VFKFGKPTAIPDNTTVEGSLGNTTYRLVLTVMVRDPQKLWDAAAKEYCRNDLNSGLRPADVLGPRESPDIEFCLRMMGDPGEAWPGALIVASEAIASS
jgi:hypothetical protein